MANINISIPDDVHKRLKYAALLQDKHIKELIIDLLERKINGKH
ncbi:MAG: hypothetical protein V1725_02020 [archaeon]